MFLDIGIFDGPGILFIIGIRIGIFPDHLSIMIVKRSSCIGISFCPGYMLLFSILGIINLAGGTMEVIAISIAVNHAKLIKNIPGLSLFSASITNSRYGICVNMGRIIIDVTIQYIKFVDKLFHIVIAGQPAIVIPVAKHIFHLR